MPESGGPKGRGRYVEANGLQMYYEEHGAGPPLILLHGGSASGAMWRPVLDLFTPHFRVLTPDSRGHGRTANPADTLSYRTMADDIAAFCAAIGLDRPLVYGYSDGGQIALELGLRHAEIARALVIGAALAQFTPRYYALIHADLPEDPPGTDAGSRLLRQIRALWLAPLAYTPAELQQITAPALVAIGDRDEVVPVEDAAALYRLLPEGELAICPGVNHGGAHRSRAFTALVLDFLLRRRGV